MVTLADHQLLKHCLPIFSTTTISSTTGYCLSQTLL